MTFYKWKMHPPLFVKTQEYISNEWWNFPKQSIEYLKKNKNLISVSTFYILIFIYFCHNYSYIIYLFINIYIIK